MKPLNGEGPPSSDPVGVTEAAFTQLLYDWDDEADRYARMIYSKWRTLQPSIEDLKAGVVEVIWDCIKQTGKTEGIEKYIRYCIFRRQSTIVAHALGFSSRRRLFAHLRQSESASYDDEIEYIIGATDCETKQKEDREFVNKLIKLSGLSGVRKEIIELMRDGCSHKEIAERLNMSTQLLAYHKRVAIEDLSQLVERWNLTY